MAVFTREALSHAFTNKRIIVPGCGEVTTKIRTEERRRWFGLATKTVTVADITARQANGVEHPTISVTQSPRLLRRAVGIASAEADVLGHQNVLAFALQLFATAGKPRSPQRA